MGLSTLPRKESMAVADTACTAKLVAGEHVDWQGNVLFNASRYHIRRSNGLPIDIDVRELIAHPASVEVHKFIDEKMSPVPVCPTNLDLCDARVKHCLPVFGEAGSPTAKLRYIHDLDEEWQMPAETINRKGGDCEDLSIMLASMLGCLDVSPYRYRVVLGFVKGPPQLGKERTLFQWHAWVMYRSDNGLWWLLEPTNGQMEIVGDSLSVGTPLMVSYDAEKSPEQAWSYIPVLCFNRDHLWKIAEEHLMKTGGVSGFIPRMPARESDQQDGEQPVNVEAPYSWRERPRTLANYQPLN